jgi:hypothetical protein
MTNYLRFADQATWKSAATEAGFMKDEILADYTHDHAIDVIGLIPEMVGYHVNFIGALPSGWNEFLVDPAHPYRVFA